MRADFPALDRGLWEQEREEMPRRLRELLDDGSGRLDR
jgi:hypothetical protein